MALEDLIESRRHEMSVYLDSMQAMYENALLQNEELYDIAAELTEHFIRIRRDAILADSRIIKILRYATAPSISQMKFGQLFGLRGCLKSLNDHARRLSISRMEAR